MPSCDTMAGNKAPRTSNVEDDKTKKRKRDSETASRSKRHRSERKERGDKKHDRSAARDSRNGQILDISKPTQALTAQGERELEISRQFDTGEAGWKVSKPMGGRMLDIDPILTDDEQ